MDFIEVDTDKMLADAKALIEELLGRTLQRADPLYIFLEGLISIIAQQRDLINYCANQNLLAFAEGEYLEKIGELVGVSRLPATAAKTTAEVTLSAPRDKTIIIKQGTRFNAGNNINFALDDAVIFGAGTTSATVSATCLQTGDVGNYFDAGAICKIVDPQPFLKSIKNITTSEGGADIEDDDNLRERIRIKPESFSVAGAAGAYVYHCKSVNEEIIDAVVDSPSAGVVDVYALMQGLHVPGDEMLNQISNTLTAETVRPLTDNVHIYPAEVIQYDIDVDFWINRDKQTKALEIVTAVENAVNDFTIWQGAKIGRDITPEELIYNMRAAGADKIVVNSPAFTGIDFNQVAFVNDININYKGFKTQ